MYDPLDRDIIYFNKQTNERKVQNIKNEELMNFVK